MSNETKETIKAICVAIGFVICLYIGAIIG